MAVTASEDLRWTALTVDDVPALTALLGRIDAADGHDEPAGEPSIREWLTMPGQDLPDGSIAVREGDHLVAFGMVDVTPSLDADGQARCNLSGGVDPAARRRGIGTRLYEQLEQRVVALAAERHPGAPAVLRTAGGVDPAPGADPSDPGGGADVRPLLARRGYRRMRSWLRMVRELPGAALPAIDTGEVRVAAPADEHREATREAHIAAFSDHWGSTPPTAERWATWWSSHTARRDLSTIALGPEGEVLSYAIASEDKPGVLHFALVGTRPTARGRGLARAVLGRSLAAAARSGYGSAELEVDSESLTGATRLYEALEFTAEKVFATYQKPTEQSPATSGITVARVG